MRKRLVITMLVIIFSAIAILFWHSEWVYSLPTPVPAKYHDVQHGDFVALNEKLNIEKGVPVFLHFFNPDCPCSKFNIPHFKSLCNKYSGKIFFAVVVATNDTDYKAEKIQHMFGLSIPVLFDSTVAKACGVYSSPQAVLLDASHKLYYRGNYNKSRYCTSHQNEYAKIAIDSFLNHNSSPVFSLFALKAYGCQLPQCKK